MGGTEVVLLLYGLVGHFCCVLILKSMGRVMDVVLRNIKLDKKGAQYQGETLVSFNFPRPRVKTRAPRYFCAGTA